MLHPGPTFRSAAFAAACLLTAPQAPAHDGVVPQYSPSGEGGFFIRGDSDQNGQIEITDPIFSLGYVFLGTESPYCMDALDANDDGKVDLSDPIITLGYLFAGGIVIPPPFPQTAIDTTADALDCDNGLFAYIRREVFATSCATTSCHSAGAAKGGLVLEGMRAYASLYQLTPDNDAAASAGLLRVKPGSLLESFLYRKITDDLAGDWGKRMPDVGPLLPQAKIDLIRDWIEHGAAPSTARDITLPPPSKGEQILIPPFEVKPGEEVQRNYYFKLKTDTEIWVNRIELLYPPGSHHLNLFTGAPAPFPDGYFEEDFKIVPFADWSLRASSQTGRLDWRLPPGVAVKFKAHDQVLAQIHFVNIGTQTSPIGGCAAINFHAVDPNPSLVPLGSLFLQNKSIVIRPNQEVSFDYGVTLDHFGHDVPVKVAGVTGHFHWRGKTFEIRRWDGLNVNLDGSPAPGEFERMGAENTIFFSDDWDEPPFELFGHDGPDLPPGWGIVYRTTYVNNSDIKYCFGPHVETQEHANAFLYFYPGPSDAGFFWFPPECIGQGCTVPCF
ncbi:MAG: hypothetical protein HY721_25470 [Planctomycetes bacterium]|nr:hypothetical protein [Planctomycetota bacterium]